jgi:predicted lipoprotein with Yx(FWY)xxD motif
MKTSTIVSIVVVAVIIILGGWWLMSSNNTPATAPVVQNTTPAVIPATTPAVTPPAQKPPVVLQTSTPVIKVSTNATFGNYLAASFNGMTLYVDTHDSKNVSTCTGSCATNWPPYTTTGKAPFVAVGSVSGQISSFTRADGTTQLTYNGMPLYFWINDSKAGDITGQNVASFVVAKP